MAIQTASLNPKASVSLNSLMGSTSSGVRRSAPRSIGYHFASEVATPASSEPRRPVYSQQDMVNLIIETEGEAKRLETIGENLATQERLQPLGTGFYTGRLSLRTVSAMMEMSEIARLQTKKRSQLWMEEAVGEVGLRAPDSSLRTVVEDGTGVYIGIVDSGFDLTHPMFYDSNGKLRVDGLLDQNIGKAYTNAQLMKTVARPKPPGCDEDGHGTHVATIAGGSSFNNIAGIAPNARFLLVKTDYFNTDEAVKWIFEKARSKPCVINISLGHHTGSHDGSDAEERLHRQMVGAGKIIVVAAGNERESAIHVGGRFTPGQREEIPFDISKPSGTEPAGATLTFWHSANDNFTLELVKPSGETLLFPPLDVMETHSDPFCTVELARRNYHWTKLTQSQITINYSTSMVQDNQLLNWRLRVLCVSATLGRIDGWFENTGFGVFKPHPMLEMSRTVGLPATGDGCICVASYVSCNRWKGDAGDLTDSRALPGRFSNFSSQGPTRDGREKPDIAAPGQYIRAALARGSMMEEEVNLTQKANRTVMMSGTSMAAPMVTGIIALLLQKKRALTPEQIRAILIKSCRRDEHTGSMQWDPTYGAGKVDVQKALHLVR